MYFLGPQTIRRTLAPLVFAFALCILGFAASGSGRNADPDQPSPHGDPILARQKWFLRGRTVKGQSAAALRERAVRQRESMVRALRTQSQAAPGVQTSGVQIFSTGTGPAWQPLGPTPLISDPTNQQSYGNVSGRVTAVTVDQSDASGNTVYAGGAYGGVWKSTNAAGNNVTWTALTDDQATLAVNAIAVSPDGNTVLVGTGEPNNAIDSYYGLGILRSTSKGTPGSWTLITGDTGGNTFRGLGFGKIAFNTTAGLTNQVVAAVSHTAVDEGSLQANSTVGLYYSTNGGASWALASVTDSGSPVAAGSVSDVVYNPSNNTFYASYRYHGFYQSTNGGQSWTRIANQPDPTDLTTAKCPTGSPNIACVLFRGQLAVDTFSGEIYVWFVDNKDTDKGIWLSSGKGANPWTSLSVSGITSCGDLNNAGCGTGQGFYDLYLSAVPDSGHTDLYAGAVNLYKASNPAAGGAFTNISHVYGCNPVNMHPDYHSQDYSHGTPNIIYFGNDGGIYRTTNGPGLVGGCSEPGGIITSLNDNIGSLTQFISFSQHRTNSAVIIGGTQDNGSPGTSSAGSSTQWAAINLGDGGFNEIDPSNSANLFTSNTDVTIQLCNTASGADPVCTFQPFNLLVNVDPNAGTKNFPDHGDFYTPYILDPANPGRLIIGTCRVWRGSAALASNWTSTSFANALSNKLNASNAQAGIPCSATETFYVSSLAAGGPAGGGGSQVIYAGMAGGFDPNTGAPIGGNVWVTTNAGGGAGTWVDRTGSINPNHYNVSSIAVDPSNSSGATAYATIMGFSGGAFGHVFKTVNAGASWTDITNNLPDAPADSIVIDPTNSADLFVGTDVGVFRSTNGGASWSPFGQAFPNVVVNKLRIFNSGGQLLLRASTHGRGIWQANLLTPDFLLTVYNPLIEVFPNQTGTFFGASSARNGYASDVSLSCTAGSTAVPGSCVPTPTVVTGGSGSFSVAASSATPQDFNFNVHGVGSDANNTVRDAPVTLRVVDYSLSAVNPSSIATFPNTTSPSASFVINPIAHFDQSVFLTCTGLPEGAACNFSPSSNIAMSPGVPVNVSVSVSTSQLSLGGAYTVTISAITASEPASKTTSFTLNVSDYTVGINPLSQAIFPSQTINFAGKLTSILNYSAPVSLSCVALQTAPPATCTLNPASATPTGAGASFTLTAGDSTIKDFSFAVQGIGADVGSTLRQKLVTLRVVDFALGALSPTGVTMPKNSISQPITFNLVPQGSFNFPVTLNCADVLPATGITCKFNNVAAPVTITPSGGALPVTLTLFSSGTAASGTVTVSASSNPSPAGPRPGGAQTQTVAVSVNSASGSTDMAVVDNAPEAANTAHAVGAPLTLALNVSNTGSAVTTANAYLTFSEPVFVQASSIGGSGACTVTGTVTDSLTCSIGAMASGANKIVSITVLPGFLRSLTAFAIANSELQDSNLGNNTTVIKWQVRPRPLAQRGIPAKLP